MMQIIPNPEFWDSLDKLIESSEIIIDRPKGFVHPEYPDFVYRTDYGYLKNTNCSDNEEIDVWLGSAEEKILIGIFCTVDFDKKDMEIKLLVGCTEEEIDYIYGEYNNFDSMKGLLILRN